MLLILNLKTNINKILLFIEDKLISVWEFNSFINYLLKFYNFLF